MAELGTNSKARWQGSMTPAVWASAVDIEAWPLGKPDVSADAEESQG